MDAATAEIYTLSLHDALPIFGLRRAVAPALGEHGDRLAPARRRAPARGDVPAPARRRRGLLARSPQIGRAHVELQSLTNLVCRLLLEKKNRTEARTWIGCATR